MFLPKKDTKNTPKNLKKSQKKPYKSCPFTKTSNFRPLHRTKPTKK